MSQQRLANLETLRQVTEQDVPFPSQRAGQTELNHL
jgi:hypothetical protein